ncbi:DUF177 domain-containing protein [Defluviimonas sp. WL0002]|uniref:DUF177 domain-containing protein n=1 Tax=Albidovulum marisflavi TaxID=2984159 RepID=A0ABT2ZBZ5_9RHOB|nr:DUF177 domain-containing protein [Defluviimonas sp. WL0002]MCV2868639.1 DUF177 domain-containing protein [Defluviimonas sp. WL0002]
MTETVPFTHPLRPAELAGRKPTRFRIAPDAPARARIADSLGVEAIPNLSFEGELAPQGRRDWILKGKLAAKVVQPCVITLAPVTTKISEKVTRRYLADMPEPEGEEVEMPEDDTMEALPAVIDLGAVLTEALSLSLPLYPRAAGAELGDAEYSEPGAEPLAEEVRRPFAGLADLLKKGQKDD